MPICSRSHHSREKRQMRDQLWRRFNPDATKGDHLWYYRELVRHLQARSDAPKVLVDEIDRVVGELEALARSDALGLT